MTLPAFAGLSSTSGIFLFGGARPEPYYSRPLPADRPIAFAHDGLVPLSHQRRRYTILAPEDFAEHVDEVREYFDLLRMQLPTAELRSHILEQRQASRREAQEHVLEDGLAQRLIRAVVGRFANASPERTVSTLVYDTMTRVLGSPLEEYPFSLSGLFPDGPPKSADRGNTWPKGDYDRGRIPSGDMVDLIIDCHIADRRGYDLITNPVTAEQQPIARQYLDCLRKGDIARYFTMH